jgi:hypothetical protein
MFRTLSRSLSFRLLAIFLMMGALFAYGSVLAIRWVYATDQLRELVSGHLSLHVEYVRDDIGNPSMRWRSRRRYRSTSASAGPTSIGRPTRPFPRWPTWISAAVTCSGRKRVSGSAASKVSSLPSPAGTAS